MKERFRVHTLPHSVMGPFYGQRRFPTDKASTKHHIERKKECKTRTTNAGYKTAKRARKVADAQVRSAAERAYATPPFIFWRRSLTGIEFRIEWKDSPCASHSTHVPVSPVVGRSRIEPCPRPAGSSPVVIGISRLKPAYAHPRSQARLA